MYNAVDVMGFAGGFTLGMVQAGFNLVGKREMKGGFGVANCEANRHLLGHNWETEVSHPESWSRVDADVVFGNPPCSGFSAMSNQQFRGADSPINECMWAFADYVAKVNPYIACFESVQQAFSRPDGLNLMRSLRKYVEDKTNEQWTLYHVLHNAYSIGGSSMRKRYFWLISRIPFGIEEPSKIRLPKLNDIIGDLDNLSTTWGQQPYRQPGTWWSSSRRSNTLTVDGHTGINNPLTKRIRDLLAMTDWLPGEDISKAAKRCYEQHGTLPSSWAATQEKIISRDFKMGFTTPTRWDGESHSRVLTGGGLQIIVHPYLKRNITHREAARILGFPDNWLIEPVRNVVNLAATWGKGITVDCGKWIGDWMWNALGDSPGSFTGKESSDKEYIINITNTYKASMV